MYLLKHSLSNLESITVVDKKFRTHRHRYEDTQTDVSN